METIRCAVEILVLSPVGKPPICRGGCTPSTWEVLQISISYKTRHCVCMCNWLRIQSFSSFVSRSPSHCFYFMPSSPGQKKGVKQFVSVVMSLITKGTEMSTSGVKPLTLMLLSQRRCIYMKFPTSISNIYLSQHCQLPALVSNKWIFLSASRC